VIRVNIHGDCNQTRELSPLPEKAECNPRIGEAKGAFVVPDSFFEPLPGDILKAFSGE